MAISSDYNIVVIGMGYIGGPYLMPGYKMLLGDKVKTNVFGVKATDKDLDKLRSTFPFSITVNNTMEILQKTHPDIVIMAPPPKQIPIVMREILLPYFNEARRQGIPLPDIYTYGPSPSPTMFYEVLGDDINCCKFLPSMATPFKGVPLQKIGASFLCFDPDHPFPEDRKQRAIAFSDLTGRTFITSHKESLLGLTSKNTSHTCYEISYAVSDALSECGISVSTSQVGSALRAGFRAHLGLEGDGLYKSSLEDVPENMREFLGRLGGAWFDGILRYLISEGCDPVLAKDFHTANFDTYSLTVQLATREELIKNTEDHATKGGTNEKAINTFMTYFYNQLKDAVKQNLAGTLPESFYDTAEGMAYAINLTTYRHSQRLADS